MLCSVCGGRTWGIDYPWPPCRPSTHSEIIAQTKAEVSELRVNGYKHDQQLTLRMAGLLLAKISAWKQLHKRPS